MTPHEADDAMSLLTGLLLLAVVYLLLVVGLGLGGCAVVTPISASGPTAADVQED